MLPDTPGAREDFEWLKTEVKATGGDASVFSADHVDAWSDDALIEEFGDPGRMPTSVWRTMWTKRSNERVAGVGLAARARPPSVACWTSSENAWPGSRVSTFSAAPAAIGSSR